MRWILATMFAITLTAAGAAEDPRPIPTLADDLKTMQGEWKVVSVRLPERLACLPPEAHLNDTGTKVVFKGNHLMFGGEVVATLANDLPAGPQHKEVGWKETNRLVLLTLESGKGLWCSYGFRTLVDGKDTTLNNLQITYPHTTSCHRGSGQVIYLERCEK